MLGKANFGQAALSVHPRTHGPTDPLGFILTGRKSAAGAAAAADSSENGLRAPLKVG